MPIKKRKKVANTYPHEPFKEIGNLYGAKQEKKGVQKTWTFQEHVFVWLKYEFFPAFTVRNFQMKNHVNILLYCKLGNEQWIITSQNFQLIDEMLEWAHKFIERSTSNTQYSSWQKNKIIWFIKIWIHYI